MIRVLSSLTETNQKIVDKFLIVFASIISPKCRNMSRSIYHFLYCQKYSDVWTATIMLSVSPSYRSSHFSPDVVEMPTELVPCFCKFTTCSINACYIWYNAREVFHYKYKIPDYMKLNICICICISWLINA